MCRIAGIANLQAQPSNIRGQVQAMCNSLQHGGPDDEGIYANEQYGFVFGHRRLSLIDLTSGGHQPMFWEEQRLVISYNGELYNYLELKKELQGFGYVFNSSSDTEVILAAYSCWGTKAFTRFNGMFAFALWDKFTEKIILARDASGIKPLYYSTAHNSLHFASEVRAFHQLSNVFTENSNWPVYLLAYGHLPEPITTLQEVQPLPKGSFLTYDVQKGMAHVESFSHYSFIEKFSKRDEVLQYLRHSLLKSVERHLLADAPIGAFLSGGIDSSIISILANYFSRDRLHTLSIYFNEGEYSEKKYQDLVAEKLQCQHQGYLLTEGIFNEHLPGIIRAMDLPSCDGINTWFISKYARESGLKAVLSGLGGDELFGGYPSFKRMKTASLLQQLPASTLRNGRYSTVKKFRRLVYLSLPGIKGKYLFLRGQFVPEEIARHLDMYESEVWQVLEEEPRLPAVNHLTYKNQASWMETNLYMQNQLLRDSDVMSMAHGIEIRVPFLDCDLVQLAMHVCSDIKYQGGPKQLLIDAFQSELPVAIYNRPKMGFAFPFKEWLSQNSFIKDQLIGKDAETDKTFALFLQGKRHWSQLLTLLLARQQIPATPHAISYA